jgi:hypothetical protein
MRLALLKNKKEPVIRAANIPGSGVGKKRYDLYANAYRKIKKARAKGFYIECIAICASIIEDRLEARRQCLNPDESSKHRFSTLGVLVHKLVAEETSDDQTIKELYKEIAKWSDKRNTAIHQIVKYGAEKHTALWKNRYRSLARTLASGLRLADRIDKKVKALNYRDYKKQNGF